MTRSRLLARQSVRQLDALAHTDTIADRASRHVEKTWAAIMRVVKAATAARDKNRQLALPYAARVELASIVRNLHHTLHTDLHNRFTGLATWGHDTAADVLGDHLTTRQMGIAVATRKQRLREAVNDEPALPPEDAEELFREMLFPPLTGRAVARLLNVSVGGTTWDRQLDSATKFVSGDVLFNVLVSGFSSGKTHQQIAKDLRPMVQGVDSTARRVARTFGMAIAHGAQMEAHKQLGDLLDGYQVHAVLDQHTRSWHAHRSGTIYYLHPKPNQKGPYQQPNPPLEAEDPKERPANAPKMAWSCRCYLTPVLAADDELPDHPEFVNAENAVIPDPAVYSDWFRQADDHRRRLAVGPRRYALVRNQLGGEQVLSTTTADGSTVEFTRHESASDAEVMMFISPHAIAPDLSSSEVRGRRAGVERFLSTGKPLQAPRLTLGKDGKPDFIDGRHRTAVLAANGAQRIAISVHRDEVEQWQRLGASIATGPGRVPEWESFIDPKDGSLLSPVFLKTETETARAERMAKVRAMVSHRKELTKQVARFGFVKA